MFGGMLILFRCFYHLSLHSTLLWRISTSRMVRFCFAFFQANPGKKSGDHLGSAGTASWSFSHVMTGEGSPSIRHSNRAMPFSSTVCDSGCWKKRDKAGERRREGKLITQCFSWEMQTCYDDELRGRLFAPKDSLKCNSWLSHTLQILSHPRNSN